MKFYVGTTVTLLQKNFEIKKKDPDILRKFIGQGIRLVPSKLYDSLSSPFQKSLDYMVFLIR